MINLLPPKEKRTLEKEKRLIMFLNLGVLVFITSLSMSLVLTAVFFHVRGKVVVSREALKAAKKEFEKSQEKSKQDIAFYNRAAGKILSYEKEQVSMVAVLKNIKQAMGKGMRLTSFSYRRRSASVSGYSPDRETLLAFKNELEKRFEKVSFPPSNWVKSQNIDFLVRISF